MSIWYGEEEEDRRPFVSQDERRRGSSTSRSTICGLRRRTFFILVVLAMMTLTVLNRQFLWHGSTTSDELPADNPPDPSDPGKDDPTDPGTDPTDPGTDPTDPGTDPTDPTDPGDTHPCPVFEWNTYTPPTLAGPEEIAQYYVDHPAQRVDPPELLFGRTIPSSVLPSSCPDPKVSLSLHNHTEVLFDESCDERSVVYANGEPDVVMASGQYSYAIPTGHTTFKALCDGVESVFVVIPDDEETLATILNRQSTEFVTNGAKFHEVNVVFVLTPGLSKHLFENGLPRFHEQLEAQHLADVTVFEHFTGVAPLTGMKKRLLFSSGTAPDTCDSLNDPGLSLPSLFQSAGFATAFLTEQCSTAGSVKQWFDISSLSISSCSEVPVDFFPPADYFSPEMCPQGGQYFCDAVLITEMLWELETTISGTVPTAFFVESLFTNTFPEEETLSLEKVDAFFTDLVHMDLNQTVVVLLSDNGRGSFQDTGLAGYLNGMSNHLAVISPRWLELQPLIDPYIHTDVGPHFVSNMLRELLRINATTSDFEVSEDSIAFLPLSEFWIPLQDTTTLDIPLVTAVSEFLSNKCGFSECLATGAFTDVFALDGKETWYRISVAGTVVYLDVAADHGIITELETIDCTTFTL